MHYYHFSIFFRVPDAMHSYDGVANSNERVIGGKDYKLFRKWLFNMLKHHHPEYSLDNMVVQSLTYLGER